jgi:hypothetical protein
MRSTQIFLLFLIGILSCDSLDNEIAGSWVIDNLNYSNIDADGNLYSNGFNLRDDHTCDLPIWNWSDRHSPVEKGKWKVYHENDKTYLEISSINSLFNRNFEITNLSKVLDSASFGYLLKMTLVADSLRMECTRSLY